MKLLGTAIILCFLLTPFVPASVSAWDRLAPLIIDHTCEGLSQVSPEWIDSVQAGRRLHYAHTSHGGQLVTGLYLIEIDDPAYSYVLDDSYLPYENGAFCIFNGQETETYITPELYWRTEQGINYTRDVLDHNPTINTSMWAWCTQLDSYTEAETADYLDSMSVLEEEYPDVIFIYMTGNAQATGPEGYNRYLRNEQIRAFCGANNKALFDFADLDSWWFNPVTEEWEHETYDYGGTDVPVEHPQFNGAQAGHTTYESCEQKGRALWWMMARIAGWQDSVAGDEPRPERGFADLHQNYPNPFSRETSISYYLPRNCRIELGIYDVAGRLVKTLYSGTQQEGPQRFLWNGRDERGIRMASGIYFYRLESADGSVGTRKMLILK